MAKKLATPKGVLNNIVSPVVKGVGLAKSSVIGGIAGQGIATATKFGTGMFMKDPFKKLTDAGIGLASIILEILAKKKLNPTIRETLWQMGLNLLYSAVPTGQADAQNLSLGIQNIANDLSLGRNPLSNIFSSLGDTQSLNDSFQNLLNGAKTLGDNWLKIPALSFPSLAEVATGPGTVPSSTRAPSFI